MQGKMTELKKCQEALRKGLENMAKEKEAKYKEKVGQMNVNTTQLESSSIKKVINTIMPKMTQRKAVVVLKFLTTVLTTVRVNRWTSMMTMVLSLWTS